MIDFTPKMRASGPSVPLILDNNLLSPHLDYDFSNMADDGKEYYRGGKRYHRPYGWRRIALNVKGQYQDRTWLGRGGFYSAIQLFSLIKLTCTHTTHA